MSTVANLTRQVKGEVKWYGLWRKTSTAKTKQNLSANILAYLDETTKADARGKSARLSYQRMALGKSEPQLAGINYLTKEETGRVRVFGFLRDDIAQLTGRHAHLLDNDTRVIACHAAWMNRLEDKGNVTKVGHKFVLSLDPRFCKLLAAAGKDADALLVQASRTVLRRFQENHYPGDRLGYLLGVHHDREHLHAHILLFPFTEKGKNLNVSNQGSDRRLSDMGKVANKLIHDYFSHEFEFPLRASQRPVERTTQIRLLGLHLTDEFKKTGLPTAQRDSWLVAEQKKVLALPEEELREILVKAYDNESIRHRQMVGTLQKKPEEMENFVRGVADWQVKHKLNIQKTYGEIAGIRARQQTLQAEMHSAYKDVSTFAFYACGARSQGMRVIGLGDEEQRKWLREALSGPNAETVKTALTALDNRKMPKIFKQEKFAKAIDRMYKQGILGPQKQAHNQAVLGTQDFMRALYLDHLEELRRSRAQLREELEAAKRKLESLRLQAESLKLVEIEVRAAVKGRKPVFLEQYEGFKRAGIALPVNCRSLAGDTMSLESQLRAAEESPEPLHPVLADAVRALRGDRTQAAALNVDRYFRVTVDMTGQGSERQGDAIMVRRHPERDAELRNLLQSAPVQQFLSLTGSTETPVAAQIEDIVQRQAEDMEFDL